MQCGWRAADNRAWFPTQGHMQITEKRTRRDRAEKVEIKRNTTVAGKNPEVASGASVGLPCRNMHNAKSSVIFNQLLI